MEHRALVSEGDYGPVLVVEGPYTGVQGQYDDDIEDGRAVVYGYDDGGPCVVPLAWLRRIAS
jgi:hypothetical protein